MTNKTDKIKTPSDGTLVIDTVLGTITIIHADGSEVVKQLPVKEVVVAKPMCNVGVSAKATYNLGNYESMQVSAMINIPAEYGEIDEVYDFARRWVDTKMTAIYKEVKGIAS